jgi:hypothetical protein
MGRAASRLQRRRRAKEILANVMARPDRAIVIHYSCESFYDRGDAPSPRITSLAVRNMETSQTRSFSIHQVVERKRYPRDVLQAKYDELERIMLDEFYDYAKEHKDHTWVHWNMRDSNFGFPALEHRYKVLGGQPPDIAEEKRVDLSSILVDIYGPNYCTHPRLKSLIDLNGISHKDVLTGAEEAQAFVMNEHVKLHQSTLRKVAVLADVARYTQEGSLKTMARWHDMYGSYAEALADKLRESWVFVISAYFLGVLSAIVTIVTAFHH